MQKSKYAAQLGPTPVNTEQIYKTVSFILNLK